MKTHPEDHWRSAVLRVVLERGEMGIGEVTALVGHLIPATEACRCYEIEARYNKKRHKNPRRLVTSTKVSRGKRGLVNERLRLLVIQGRLRRVTYGVYGPPLPKIYQPKVAG